MTRDMKAILGVTLLVLGLLQGANMFVLEDQERTVAGWLWTILLLGGAVLFWLWMQRDQRTAEEAAQETLDEAENQLEVAEQAALEAQARTEERVEEAVEAAETPEPEPAAPSEPPQAVEEAQPEPEPTPATEEQTVPTISGEPDDLTRINGIGPSYRDILVAADVDTYAKLAAMSEDEIVKLVRDNGGRKSATMATWAEQAKLAAAGDWDGLEKLQNS